MSPPEEGGRNADDRLRSCWRFGAAMSGEGNGSHADIVAKVISAPEDMFVK